VARLVTSRAGRQRATAWHSHRQNDVSCSAVAVADGRTTRARIRTAGPHVCDRVRDSSLLIFEIWDFNARLPQARSVDLRGG